MSFPAYLFRRLLHIIPALVGLSILMFLISRVLPGDPARLALGPEATAEQVEQLRREMGLDKPLVTQYTVYISGLFRGDFGFSLRTRRNVAQDIREFLPATVELTTVAMLFAVGVGVPLGVVSAVRKDRAEDHVSRLIALAGVAIPRFWLAILLQLVFAYYLGVLPTIGRGPGPPVRLTGLHLLDSLLTANPGAFLTALRHVALPAFALSLGSLAQITRLVRANMIEEMRKDYALAARSYGLPDRVIIYKYVLKNAFSSALTVIGLSYGFLLGNAFLVEAVFAWPGLAFYGVDSLLFKDLNAVMGVTLVVGVAFAVANLLVDVAYSYLDPRIRYEA